MKSLIVYVPAGPLKPSARIPSKGKRIFAEGGTGTVAQATNPAVSRQSRMRVKLIAE
jgi:hypothetical protein